MDRETLLIPLIGAGASFGASGAVLALMGTGVPFLMAAFGASSCVGCVLWGVSRRSATIPPPHGHDRNEAIAATLRHDLRGALSPALMVSDRLVANPDPAVAKAGAAVVRSIERATALLTAPHNHGPPHER